MDKQNTLNLAAAGVTEWTTGPGRFLTLWVQGCRRRCPGCANPSYLDEIEKYRIPVERVAVRCREQAIDGLCFSGGEPFLQAHALATLARAVRADGLSVVSYSGYTLEELRSVGPPESASLLENLDILIDGPFLVDQAASLLWRGSRNQRIHLLSRRYPASILEHPAVSEVSIDETGFLTVGNPNPALLGLQRMLLQKIAAPQTGFHNH